MGRAGADIADDSRWVFNRLARDYRARPPYPPELIDRLAELAGGPGRTAVDLGAGTGLVALPLAERGLQVFAVEPARAMLAVLGESDHPRVTLVHAAAEATGLPARSADLVVIADALQWVDGSAAGREIARILRPGGAVAVVEPRMARTPLMLDIVALVEAANFKARAPRKDTRREHLLRAAAASSAAVSEPYHDAAPLDGDRIDSVLRSLSLVGPALGPAALARLLGEARRAVEAHEGASWERDITLTWART